MKSDRSKEITNSDWIELQSENALEQILSQSYDKPQIIFKHSYRCGISKVAMYEFEKDWDFNKDQVDLHYLDLLTYRPISNKVAEDLDVTHQSPQVILIKNGEAIYNTSHSAIKVSKLKKHLVD